MAAHDYSQYIEKEASSDKLARLTRLAEQQVEAEARVERCQAELQRANDALRDIAEQQIPLLMQELNLKTFTLGTGQKITLDEQLRISIPQNRRSEAHAWIEQHGGEELIRRSFVIRFSKDQEAWARKFQRDLNQRKRPVDCERTTDIPPSTTKRFIKDKLEEGTDVPLELFGGYFQRRAKIST